MAKYPYRTLLTAIFLSLATESIGWALNQFVMPVEQFDQWVFQGNRTARQTRKTLETQLSLRVEAVGRSCELTEEQTAKLQLAGQGDIKRFFQEVEKVRKTFLALRNDQNAINRIFQEIQPLQRKLNSGIFDETSFFDKVLQRTVNAEQSAKYEQAEQQRRQFRYEAKVALAVAMIERGVPLRDEQRQRFLTLLLTETKPPLKFGQYDYYVVLYQAARLREDKLKPIFDDAQWQAVSQHLTQAKGMEQFLKEHGFVP